MNDERNKLQDTFSLQYKVCRFVASAESLMTQLTFFLFVIKIWKKCIDDKVKKIGTRILILSLLNIFKYGINSNNFS